jgi:hypothetical protein
MSDSLVTTGNIVLHVDRKKTKVFIDLKARYLRNKTKETALPISRNGRV